MWGAPVTPDHPVRASRPSAMIAVPARGQPGMTRRRTDPHRHTRWRLAVLSIVAAVMLIGSVHAQTAPNTQTTRTMPRLVICPPGDGMRALFEHPDEWTQTRAQTGAILAADHNLAHFSDADLQSWFAMMRTWNISLELEVGAIKKWGPTADATLRAEQPMWDRAVRLGANLASIVMDGPLISARHLDKPDAYAIEQTTRFIAMVRQRYPTMLIGDTEPYPTIPVDQHIAWLKQLLASLRAQNLAPLDFHRLDVDWVSFTKADRGSWHDLASLPNASRGLGVPFSLIYWASAYPSEKKAGFADEDTWYVEVLNQGYAVADAGIHPDQFVLESWINTPARIVPETADFSFTRSVLDFARKFVSPASAPPKPLGK